MKIEISRITQEGIRLSHDYDNEEMDLSAPDIRIKKPLHAEIYCYKISNAVTCEAELSLDYGSICSRCLNSIENQIKKKIKLSFMVRPGDRFVDTTSDIREEVVLGYPLKPLCKDGCKGLCPKCGKNLNEGKCECTL
jgi:uncharacterized protein